MHVVNPDQVEPQDHLELEVKLANLDHLDQLDPKATVVRLDPLDNVVNLDREERLVHQELKVDSQSQHF